MTLEPGRHYPLRNQPLFYGLRPNSGLRQDGVSKTIFDHPLQSRERIDFQFDIRRATEPEDHRTIDQASEAM